MKKVDRRMPLLACAASLTLGGFAVAQDDPAPPSIARFMKIRAPGSPTVAPDGSLYVVDWPEGVNQLFRRPRGAALDADMHRMTSFEDGVNGYSLSPDGRTIVVTAAIGGSEQDDLFRLDPATGKIEPIFSDPDVVYGFQHWLADSSGFYYTANAESPSDFYVYRYDLASGASKRLLDRQGYWFVTDATDDGSRVLLGRYISAAHVESYELDTKTGDVTTLDLQPGVYNAPGVYLPGEQRVTITCDMQEGIRRLFVLDLKTGEATKPFPELDPHPIEGGAINERRSLAAITYNEGGYRSMRIVETARMQTIEVPGIERGLVGSVQIRGRQLTWTMSNTRNPGIAYAWRVGSAGEPRALTVAHDQGIDLSTFTLPELITFESFDGREIPAFIATPPGFRQGTPVPFVVVFHGGPEGQSRPSFNRTVQYLLSRGFGVMLPNVRGSVGYGREYHMLDNYHGRWDSVRDGAEAARWLVREGYARAGKIAAYGGSYGGFMAVATVIEGADVFGASVDVVGIVNFKTFLEQTKDYRRKLREVEYGPLSDPEFLESISPINRLDEIKVPMLIAHGLNDPRVPIGEAMQLAVGLQKRGYDPEQLYFADEGHGFAKLENRLLFYEQTARFLEKTIGD